MLVDDEGEALERIPDTVQALIAARIDGLDADEKRVLQSAALIGRVFWRGALDALAPDLDVGCVARRPARARVHRPGGALDDLGRPRVPVQARADPRRRVRRDEQGAARRGAPGLRRLGRRARAGRARRHPRAPPRRRRRARRRARRRGAGRSSRARPPPRSSEAGAARCAAARSSSRAACSSARSSSSRPRHGATSPRRPRGASRTFRPCATRRRRCSTTHARTGAATSRDGRSSSSPSSRCTPTATSRARTTSPTRPSAILAAGRAARPLRRALPARDDLLVARRRRRRGAPRRGDAGARAPAPAGATSRASRSRSSRASRASRAHREQSLELLERASELAEKSGSREAIGVRARRARAPLRSKRGLERGRGRPARRRSRSSSETGAAGRSGWAQANLGASTAAAASRPAEQTLPRRGAAAARRRTSRASSSRPSASLPRCSSSRARSARPSGSSARRSAASAAATSGRAPRRLHALGVVRAAQGRTDEAEAAFYGGARRSSSRRCTSFLATDVRASLESLRSGTAATAQPS